MKKLLFAFFLLSASIAFASEADSVKVKKIKELTPEQQAEKAARQAKKSEVEKRFQKFSKDRFAIDLLGTNWIYKGSDPGMNGLKTKWYSRGINIYFYWDFRIKKSRVSFAPGIGYSCSNIYSRHGLVEDSSGTSFRALETPSDYKVNKITLQYVDVPLELRIKTNPDKFNNCFKFAIGFKAGIRVDAHTKQKTKIDNVVKVDIERRFPDFNLWRMGPTFRFGYSSFNITAYYGVLGVFKKDRGPKANEFALGISFNGL
jgi:hypothetical protein